MDVHQKALYPNFAILNSPMSAQLKHTRIQNKQKQLKADDSKTVIRPTVTRAPYRILPKKGFEAAINLSNDNAASSPYSSSTPTPPRLVQRLVTRRLRSGSSDIEFELGRRKAAVFAECCPQSGQTRTTFPRFSSLSISARPISLPPRVLLRRHLPFIRRWLAEAEEQGNPASPAEPGRRTTEIIYAKIIYNRQRPRNPFETERVSLVLQKGAVRI